MSVCVDTVLSLDGLGELKAVEGLNAPNGIAMYSRDALLKAKKDIEAIYPSRPGLFDKNKIAAREMSLARHQQMVAKAERRLALAKIKNAFYVSLRPHDAAVSRINFELSELNKLQGKPASPKSKRPKKGGKPKRKSPSRSSKRSRRSKDSDDMDSESDSEWKGDEGDEGDDGDDLASLEERFGSLDQAPAPPSPRDEELRVRLARLDGMPAPPISPSRPMSAPVRAV